MNKQREISSFSRAIGIDMLRAAPANPQPREAVAAESDDQVKPGGCRINCFEPESQEPWA